MRIALVAHSNAPWTAHYAKHFLARGHEVLLASYYPEAIAGVRTVLLNGPGQASLPKHRYLTTLPTLRRTLRDFDPAVVLAPYILSNGLAASLAWSGPLVVSARGTDVFGGRGGGGTPLWLRRKLLGRVCRRASFVHVVSEELAESLLKLGAPKERLVCFPVGVDVESFRRADARPPFSRSPLLICTRAHKVVYDNQVIVEALSRLHGEGIPARLLFVSGGPLLEKRRRQVERLGLTPHVQFIPGVPHEQIPGLLAEADIYVSASRHDGTSSSLLEALAAGLVPVVSRVRANLHWIRDGETGFFFEAGDAAGLVRAVRQAIERPDVARRAMQENPALVRGEASLEANCDRLLRVLQTAADGRLPSDPL
jgi:glycosyltransferase involved in cell wall biosynthesis